VKRVNVRFVLALLGGLIATAIGLFALNRYQVDRNAGGLAKMARQRLQEGKPVEALGLFARYLGMRPQDAAVHAEYAKLLLERSQAIDASQADLSKTYSALEQAVRRNPKDSLLRRQLAEFQVRVGRYADAREHLLVLTAELEAAGQSPDGSAGEPPPADAGDRIDPREIQLLLARSYAGSGEFEEATRLAGELCGYDVQSRSFDPNRTPADSSDAYVLLATILKERIRDPISAELVLEKLVERRSDDAQAWLAMSRWHRDSGDLVSAATEMDKALELAPEDANVLFGAFELALAKQDLDGAEQIAEQAQKLYAADERVFRGLAAVALQRQDLESAERILREGVGELPNKASLLLMLADTLLQRNKLDEVEQTIRRIEELYGASSVPVGLLKSRLLIARLQWPQARQKLESLRPLAAGMPDYVRQIDICLAQCYENLAEFDEQLNVSRRLLIDDPTSLAARVGAAGALAAGGRADEALAEFESVAAALPADRLASIPQVWYPLLQLRVAAEIKKPVSDRDWATVEGLIGTLEQSDAVSSEQLALLRSDVLAWKGETEAAIELLQRVVGDGPGSPPLWSALASLTLRAEGPEATRAVLDRVPAEQAKSAGLLALRAQVAARDEPAAASAQLAQIEAEAATLPEADAAQVFFTLGALRLDGGSVTDAERLWQAAAARRPDDLRSRSALLELAIKTSEVDKARAAAEAIEAISGADSARARVARAAVCILDVRTAQDREEIDSGRITLSAADQRTLVEARGLLIEAENDRPGWPVIQSYFAEVEILQGDLPAAIECLQRSLRLGPGNATVVRQLVSLLYASNRLEEAQRALESLGPEGVAGFERISAEMELRSGRLDEAVALAERSVSADSKNVKDLLWLGQLLERSGKAERANELFNRAVELGPDKPEAWLTLFSLQLSSGRRQAAERTLERAGETLEPPARHLVLAQGAEMLGRLDDADAAFIAASKAKPDDLGIARTRAEFLLRRGRKTEAVEALNGLLTMKGEGIDAAPNRAWARRKLAGLIAERGSYGDLQEALALLDSNADADGMLPPDDAIAKISLLANRQEPANWQAAIFTLLRLREQQPLTTGQRLTLAGLLDKVGRWGECREEMMAIVAASNTPPAFIAMLVDKLINHGEIATAAPWFKRLQTVAPTAPVTLALEARMAVAENDRPRAAEVVARLMPGEEVTREQTGQLAALSRLFDELGLTKAADKVLEQWAGLAPEGVIARADFLGRQNRGAEALDLLERSWDALPLEQLLTRGVSVVRSSGADPALAARLDAWIVKARRIDPGSIMVELLEAELRDLEGRPAEADTIYRSLLDRADVSPLQKAIVANNLAFHLATPETAAEADRLVASAIETLGPHPDLLDTRGMVRLALGQDREALADLEEAALAPSDVKLLHLAYARLRNGDRKAAGKALEEGRKKGLASNRLTAADQARLEELEKALDETTEQAGDGVPGVRS
jgi:tetratricopeptide (TPR) repeat protein